MTLVELLVALSVTVVITGAALAVGLSCRRLFQVDQNRTALNQNLRAGIDLVGIDVRQAGERLPADVPAIEVVNGESGAGDTLVLRRNLIDPVLPVCKDVKAGTNQDNVFVAGKLKKIEKGKLPQGCAPVEDGDGDGWPDNLQAWRDYRVANGGAVLAYIYNPTTGAGEFFLYDAEDQSTFKLHKSNAAKWQFDYDVDDQARIYILEQRSYDLDEDILRCVLNGDTANALHVVGSIRDFQVRAFLQDGSVLESLSATDPWTNLSSIEVDLDGRREFQGRTMDRSLSTRFFPRNVLSR